MPGVSEAREKFAKALDIKVRTYCFGFYLSAAYLGHFRDRACCLIIDKSQHPCLRAVTFVFMSQDEVNSRDPLLCAAVRLTDEVVEEAASSPRPRLDALDRALETKVGVRR